MLDYLETTSVLMFRVTGRPHVRKYVLPNICSIIGCMLHILIAGEGWHLWPHSSLLPNCGSKLTDGKLLYFQMVVLQTGVQLVLLASGSHETY